MHVQVKSPVNPAAFSDEVEDDEGSVVYPRFALAEFLAVLAADNGPNDPPFNLGAASGHDIELGGEFAFWAKPRDGVDADHEEATFRAMERLQGAGYDAKGFHVQAKHISDEPGALLAFVNEVSDRGHRILEITVGAPEEGAPRDHMIPVQIFTATAG
jgi:hypothetical protein